MRTAMLIITLLGFFLVVAIFSKEINEFANFLRDLIHSKTAR